MGRKNFKKKVPVFMGAWVSVVSTCCVKWVCESKQKVVCNVLVKMYHATFDVCVQSIMENGLVPNLFENWNGLSRLQKGIYLSDDPDFCIWFCNSAKSSTLYKESKGIVLLSVVVDSNSLHRDENIMEDYTKSYIYKQTISPDKITVVSNLKKGSN